MHNLVEIEDIEEMRRREGIDDIALRVGIRELKVGNFVRLSLITGPATSETLSVRITSIRGSSFRGKLADKPLGAALSKVGIGTPLVFSTTHIHSLANVHTAHEP